MNFPLELRFKIVAFASQIAVRDAAGSLLCYVKQKAFKLKEAVTIFGDEAQTRPLYRIGADRVIDIAAEYRIDDIDGRPLGVVKRRGMRSFWRAHYDVSRDGQPVLSIQEENPWVKVADGLLTQIPLVGMLSGYVFNPAYLVTHVATGTTALRVVKRPAFLEGRYRVDAQARMGDEDERLGLLSILMVLLLERQRGCWRARRARRPSTCGTPRPPTPPPSPRCSRSWAIRRPRR
jgi:hypothetical protein